MYHKSNLRQHFTTSHQLQSSPHSIHPHYFIFFTQSDPINPVAIGNLSIGFYDLKYASIISLVRDRGTPILFAGFWLSVASLFAMYFIIPRRIWVEVLTDRSGTFVYICGNTDRFTSYFEDGFLKIVEEIGENIDEVVNNKSN